MVLAVTREDVQNLKLLTTWFVPLFAVSVELLDFADALSHSGSSGFPIAAFDVALVFVELAVAGVHTGSFFR